MRTLAAKIALLAIVVGGFVCTGDLPRLFRRGSEVFAPATGGRGPAATGPEAHNGANPSGHAATAQHTPRRAEPAGSPAQPPSASRAANAGETDRPPRAGSVPLPSLRREPVAIDALAPGDRVLVRVSGELVAFDLIDATSGEAIEHRHVVRADGTVDVAAREAPRRVRVVPMGGSPAAGGQLRVESTAAPATARIIGPIIALGVERG